MPDFMNTLPKDEQIILALRHLYHTYGYKKYRMGKFEAYDLYAENKSFLKSEGIITFQDKSGKLMALKPDVTLSIVKNAKACGFAEKYYYIENVFRFQPQNGEYKEISQMGVEYLGDIDLYASIEVVSLALQSLRAVERDYVLEFSHMGFVEGILTATGLTGAHKAEALRALSQKNSHELYAVAKQAGADEVLAQRLAQLALLGGNFYDTLQQAQSLSVSTETATALKELQLLYDALAELDLAQNLRLDFSITNNIDYYNGIIFQGYVEGIPRVVLAGGRYDNLVKRFDKPVQALGFALYLDEIARAVKAPLLCDAEIVLLYEKDVCVSALHRQIAQLVAQGHTVSALTKLPQEFRYNKLYRFNGTALEEVPSC